MLSPCSRCQPPIYKANPLGAPLFDNTSNISIQGTFFPSKGEDRNESIIIKKTVQNKTLFVNLSGIGNKTSNNLFNKEDTKLPLDIHNMFANNSISSVNPSKSFISFNVYDNFEEIKKEENCVKSENELIKNLTSILISNEGLLKIIKDIFDEKFKEKETFSNNKIDEMHKQNIAQEEKIRNLENKLFNVENELKSVKNELNEKTTKINLIENSLKKAIIVQFQLIF